MTSRLFLFVVCLLDGLVCAAFLSRGDSVSLSLGVSKLVILRHRFGCVLFHRVCLLFVFRKFVPPHKDSLSPGLTKSIGYITASRLYVIPKSMGYCVRIHRKNNTKNILDLNTKEQILKNNNLKLTLNLDKQIHISGVGFIQLA